MSFVRPSASLACHVTETHHVDVKKTKQETFLQLSNHNDTILLFLFLLLCFADANFSFSIVTSTFE